MPGRGSQQPGAGNPRERPGRVCRAAAHFGAAIRRPRTPPGVARAVLGATDQFTVNWQPKSGGSDKAAGLANVTDTIAVVVGDGVVQTAGRVRLSDPARIRSASCWSKCRRPSGCWTCTRAGLRDWQAETAGGRQRVKVRLHAPATEAVRLELHTEAPIPQQAFEAGRVRAVGAARESGILAVRSSEDVGLEHVLRGIDHAHRRTARRRRRCAPRAAPSTSSIRRTISCWWPPRQLKPRITVESHLRVDLERARLTAGGDFFCQVSRSGIFALSFRLPAGFQVDEVRTGLDGAVRGRPRRGRSRR